MVWHTDSMYNSGIQLPGYFFQKRGWRATISLRFLLHPTLPENSWASKTHADFCAGTTMKTEPVFNNNHPKRCCKFETKIHQIWQNLRFSWTFRSSRHHLKIRQKSCNQVVKDTFDIIFVGHQVVFGYWELIHKAAVGVDLDHKCNGYATIMHFFLKNCHVTETTACTFGSLFIRNPWDGMPCVRLSSSMLPAVVSHMSFELAASHLALSEQHQRKQQPKVL